MQSVSDRNEGMRSQLSRVHATLDLLWTVARSEDAFADIDALNTRTLDSALYGMLGEVDRVIGFIESLPCRADYILLLAITEMERWIASIQAERVRAGLEAVLKQLTVAHQGFEKVLHPTEDEAPQ